ncbi:MAG: ComF family protein [Clostridia bacterium]|nr:ComF family protein [Clostridia bacterium]
MNRMVRFLKGLTSLIYPNHCFFCGDTVSSDRARMCDACLKRFGEEAAFPCPVCGKTASDCGCGAFYLKREIFPNVRVASAFFYSPDPKFRPLEMARSLILRCKQSYSPELAEELARKIGFRLTALLEQQGETTDGWIVTYPPRSGDNLLRYGFDHGEMIANALARQLGLPCRKTMFRVSGKKQKELASEERYANAAGSLACIERAVVRGGKYILVDDVITTGATVAVAADLLYRHGASAVLPAAPAKTLMKRSRSG